MITNERQYRITKSRLADFEGAIAGFSLQAAEKKIGSKILAKAELEALKSEREALAEEVEAYDKLRGGLVTSLEANSLNELSNILIHGRIARGLSQKQLATLLDLKEQQIQRYEAEGYASASLTKLSKVAEALQLDFHEVAQLKPFEGMKVAETKTPRYSTKDKVRAAAHVAHKESDMGAVSVRKQNGLAQVKRDDAEMKKAKRI
jgi:HTH-type transcriptional regulator / antitoxin HipB